MANYKQVSYGSQGDDVKALQEKLNSKGYNLTVDGIFGANTKSAVEDYQKSKGLTVDGIAGDETWGSFDSSNTSATSTAQAQAQAQAAAPATFTPASYEKSDIVKQAEAAVQQHMANKPGAYQSQHQEQINDIINRIMNREKFEYDLNGDMLYQQYKDQAVVQGQQAALDVMGKAQAMTGGYGSSYAQSVGQQAYQGYLQQLNDKVPELYQLALDQYNQEGQDMYNQYGLLVDRENQDYSRYRDEKADFYTDLDYLTNEARYQSEQDYGRHMDRAQFDEAKRQYDEQMALANGSSSKSGVKTGKYGDGIGDGIVSTEQKGVTTGNDKTADHTDTENAKLFRSSVMSQTEFARHGNKGTVNGKTYTDYKSYIEACLADWTDNDVPSLGTNLTDDEVNFLMDYYGL